MVQRQRIILHLDLNSYFASVEQQANPFLRGKPVGVCAYLPKTATGDGCIIASSIEAKKVGVTTGMRISDARRIYPAIILVQNEPTKYRSTTERIFAILAEYSDRVEPYSIDEAFMDLTGWVPCLAAAEPLARTIQARIAAEVGEWLRASVGIAPTRWLAKFGSDIAPKGGVLVLTPDALEATFARVVLTDAWGIKQRTAARLWQLGITTLNELRRANVANLITAMGVPGYYLWANVNGIELEGVRTAQATQPKSIGHSYCLPRRTADRAWLRRVLAKLCARTGRRLRAKRLEARSISGACGLVHGGGIGGSRRLAHALFTTAEIFTAADALLFAHPLPHPARFLAVSVSDLAPMSNQASLFGDAQRPRRLELALDAINSKFGEDAVVAGAMWGTAANAPDRVGYRKTLPIPESTDTIRAYIPEPT